VRHGFSRTAKWHHLLSQGAVNAKGTAGAIAIAIAIAPSIARPARGEDTANSVATTSASSTTAAREPPRVALRLEDEDRRARFEVSGERGLIDACDGACTLIEPVGTYRVRVVRGRHAEETEVDLQSDRTVRARARRKTALGFGVASVVVGGVLVVTGFVATAAAGGCLGECSEAKRREVVASAASDRWKGIAVLGAGAALCTIGGVLLALSPATIRVEKGISATSSVQLRLAAMPMIGGGSVALIGSF
jgi:hypothetical protein